MLPSQRAFESPKENYMFKKVSQIRNCTEVQSKINFLGKFRFLPRQTGVEIQHSQCPSSTCTFPSVKANEVGTRTAKKILLWFVHAVLSCMNCVSFTWVVQWTMSMVGPSAKRTSSCTITVSTLWGYCLSVVSVRHIRKKTLILVEDFPVQRSDRKSIWPTYFLADAWSAASKRIFPAIFSAPVHLRQITWQRENISNFIFLTICKFCVCNNFFHFQLAAIRDKCGVYMEGGEGAKCIKFPLDSISFDHFFLLGIFFTWECLEILQSCRRS